MQLTDQRHAAEIESLRAEVRTSQKPAEPNQQIQALTEEINSLRESLHQQQISVIQEQNKAMIERLESQVARLEQQLLAAAQGKSVETKLGLLEKTVDKVATGLDSARQDAKGFATMMLSKGETPVPRTPGQRRAFSQGLGKAIERQEEAKKLAEKLWGPKQ